MAYRNSDIERYLKGELTPAEMHALEQKALRDPFLADALEGAEHAGAEPFSMDIELLQRSVYDKTHRKRRLITMSGWQLYMGIAASLLILAVSSFIVLNMIRDQSPQSAMLALKKDSGVAADSVAAKDPTVDDSAGPAANQSNDAEERQTPSSPSREYENDESSDAIVTAPAETVVPDGVESETRSEALAEAELEQPTNSAAVSPETETRVAESVDKSDGDVSGETAEEEPKRKQGIRSGRDASVFLALDKSVRGKVVSLEDGSPLAGVNVLIKGTNKGTITNADGFFSLEVPGTNDSLVFSFIGLTSREVKVKDDAEVKVAMQSDPSQLSEMVVTGYGVADSDKDPAVMEMAVPEGGRNAYKKYLEEQLQYPQQALENEVKGKVTVQFTVQPNGQLSDFQVIKGLGYGCDEELIRLIKEGPAWVPSKKDNQPVEEKVKIRVNFTLPEKKD